MLGVAATLAAYAFAPGVRLSYSVEVVFDGFIPLFGGREAKAEVGMTVAVDGLAPEEGELRAASEIVDVEIKLDGAKLPLTVENVRGFFPRTTIRLTPQGRVIASDAPDVQLPVRLPGLHVKRFPDVTYLPIQFPEEGIEVGREFTFTRAFGESEVEYRCTPTKIDGDTAQIDLRVRQVYETLETDALEVVSDERDVVRRVATTVEGNGEAVFDLRRGALRSLKMEASSVGKATVIATGEQTVRRLKTRISTKLR